MLPASACEWLNSDYPTSAGERSLVVHGMLTPDAEEQEIILEYTRHVHEGAFRGVTPASRARMTVSGTTPHEFREDPERPGVYRASFAPVPGERYLLRIEGPGGERVEGETRVPLAPRFLAPGADTAVALGSYVTLHWSSAPAAAGFVVMDAPEGSPSSISALLYPVLLADTSLTLQPGAYGGRSFRFRVAAVDANYRRYAERAPADPAERIRIRSTVRGAYGLFGSYASSTPRTIEVR